MERGEKWTIHETNINLHFYVFLFFIAFRLTERRKLDLPVLGFHIWKILQNIKFVDLNGRTSYSNRVFCGLYKMKDYQNATKILDC